MYLIYFKIVHYSVGYLQATNAFYCDRQAIIVSAVNNGTAFLAGFVIFSVIGKFHKSSLCQKHE